MRGPRRHHLATPHTARRNRSTNWRRWAISMSLAALVAIAITGCKTPEQRYRVLSFFFDGVPLPESMRSAEEQSTEGAEELNRTDRPAAGRAQFLSFHRPFVDRKCFQCHSRSNSFQISMTDITPCRSCHDTHLKDVEGDWVHGPLAVGDCGMCHLPHKSEYYHLLTKPQPDVCFFCHDSTSVLEKPYHESVTTEEQTCGSCHDPHRAGNKLLLVDSRTYQHRRLKVAEPKSVHVPFKEQKCATCHDTEQVNRVRDNMDAICMSCHEQISHTASATAHQPIREGKCVACHHPHQSSRPHLVRVTAENMCYECHTVADVLTPQHPPTARADCLICHFGHESDRPKLLRPTIATDRFPSVAPTKLPPENPS